jgi:hypothetical protein
MVLDGYYREALRPSAPNVSVGEGLKPLLYDEIILKESPMPRQNGKIVFGQE